MFKHKSLVFQFLRFVWIQRITLDNYCRSCCEESIQLYSTWKFNFIKLSICTFEISYSFQLCNDTVNRPEAVGYTHIYCLKYFKGLIWAAGLKTLRKKMKKFQFLNNWFRTLLRKEKSPRKRKEGRLSSKLLAVENYQLNYVFSPP